MTCIVCGSKSSYKCSIRGMTVCFCARHAEKERYDVMAPEEDFLPAILPPGEVSLLSTVTPIFLE